MIFSTPFRPPPSPITRATKSWRQQWGAPSLILSKLGDLDGNTAGSHCAFGWPDTSYGTGVSYRDADGPVVHLLQLAEDEDLG
ncbi:hypothetical protein [Streptomyces klenkii]|uniref:hypothetical protein n=1 Tax=Streptomyces klenkii TaxID=1420899 RepID=UPI001F53FFB6|nr:hypothetical protein [Streptomyces klenkii]